MKPKTLLIISDTHGKSVPILKIAEEELPDMIVHLGDHVSDAEDIRYLTEAPCCCVLGNCDDDSTYPESAEFSLGGIKFLAVHGHRYGVKYHLNSLESAARSAGVDVVLFGHTHTAYLENKGGLTLLNPGSLGSPHFGHPATYALFHCDREHPVVVIKEYPSMHPVEMPEK